MLGADPEHFETEGVHIWDKTEEGREPFLLFLLCRYMPETKAIYVLVNNHNLIKSVFRFAEPRQGYRQANQGHTPRTP